MPMSPLGEVVVWFRTWFDWEELGAAKRVLPDVPDVVDVASVPAVDPVPFSPRSAERLRIIGPADASADDVDPAPPAASPFTLPIEAQFVDPELVHELRF